MSAQIYGSSRVVSILLLIFFAEGKSAWAGDSEVSPQGSNAYQMVTGSDSDDGRSHWDALYRKDKYVYGVLPAAFLKENIALLPIGRALDIAMGEGRNAVFLAKKGFSVEGVDFSDVAILKAKRLAHSNHVTLSTINADLSHYTIKPESYDLIVNIDFLMRPLVAQIKRGLRHGGVVVFQNHTLDQQQNTTQRLRRDELLAKGELKTLFADFDILVYRETNDGKEALASLVARKR